MPENESTGQGAGKTGAAHKGVFERFERVVGSKTAISVAALLCMFATFMVYLKTITFGFVNWDDNYYVIGNTLYQKSGWSFLKDVFSYTYVANWHPLTMLSYKFDHIFWGDDPMGYHLTNVVLHTIATGLVFILGHRVFLLVFSGENSEKAALAAASAAAVLFGLHPIHVESVAWVSERKDVLSTVFFTASMIFYLRYRSAGKTLTKPAYALAILSFILALLSKPMAVTLPAVLLILDFYPLRRILSLKTLATEVINKIPFFALSAAVSVVTVAVQKQGMSSLEAKPLLMRVSHALSAYVFYLKKTLLPDVLLPFYDPVPNISFFSAQVLVSAAVVIGITTLGVFWLRRRPYVAAAWVSYLVTLLPVIGLFQVGNQAAADRYMYIPSIGLFLLAGAGVSALLFAPRIGRARLAVAAVALAVAVVMAARTSAQIGIWKDSYTLWTHQIEHFDGRVELLPLAKRGAHLLKVGRVDESIADLTMAIGAYPDNWILYGVRARGYETNGEFDKAALDYKSAIALNKAWALAGYKRLALVYSGAGDGKKALYYEDLVTRLSRGEVLSGEEFQKSVSPVKLVEKGAAQDEVL